MHLFMSYGISYEDDKQATRTNTTKMAEQMIDREREGKSESMRQNMISAVKKKRQQTANQMNESARERERMKYSGQISPVHSRVNCVFC